jgi:hypothetical protein
MAPARRHELYRSFLEFVGNDVQRERKRVNRRILGVFLWCFVLPAIVSLACLVLVRFGIFPHSIRNHLDRLILLFPVVYSLYVVGAEMANGLPIMFRRGGIASSLGDSVKESEWRDRVCREMVEQVPAAADEWRWISASFAMDLQQLRARNRFLTALAGAVFYLLMQGIDYLGDLEPAHLMYSGSPLGQAGVDLTSPLPIDFSQAIPQFVGLALFLVLLYLSGNQTYQALVRYLHSAKLVAISARDQAAED